MDARTPGSRYASGSDPVVERHPGSVVEVSSRGSMGSTLTRRLVMALAVLAIVVIGGGVGYYLIGGGRWPLGDCVYMTVISVTTVGYGEVLQGMDRVPYAGRSAAPPPRITITSACAGPLSTHRNFWGKATAPAANISRRTTTMMTMRRILFLTRRQGYRRDVDSASRRYRGWNPDWSGARMVLNPQQSK